VALNDVTRKRVEAEARKRGVDPAKAMAEAERHAKSGPPDGAESAEAGTSPTRPLADRLLIGFLPFIKVHELRSIWLGLSERIPDDELTCGDYAAKHGGGNTPPSESE